ncbi:MAG: PAS domain S-box protein [Anaerolineae bacterium]|nr:PAS domain S-box protein [Anaerolineae bacterium]
MSNTPNKWMLRHNNQREEEKRLARILLIIILIYWVGSGFILFMDLVWGDYSLWLLITSGCILQLIPMVLLRQGKLSESSLATVGIYITFITIAATLGQGIHDYALIVYPVMIMFAGLAQKRRGMIFATGLTLVGITWLTFGDIYGLYNPKIDSHATLFDYVILIIIIIISNGAVHLLIEHLNYTNTQLKVELEERHKTEEALKQSREMYRLLAENVSDVIWIYDVIENRTRYISPSVERLRGYTPEEVIAGNMENALMPASFQYVQKSIASRLKDFQSGHRAFYVDELEQTCKDGSTVWTEVTANFQINPENGHIEIYGVSRNINEKRQAREALLASEERIRQLVGSAPYSIFGIDQDGTINFANTEASSLIGYSTNELVGKNVDELLPDRFQEFHAAHRNGYSEKPFIRQLGTGINLLAKHKDGREIPVDIKLSYYHFEDSLHIIAFMQDISERKKAEERLRDSEARFRLLFETMVQGVVFQSKIGEVVLANPAAERLLGLTSDQMQGRTSMDPRWRTIYEDGSDLPGQEHPAMIALRTGQEVRNVVLGVFNPQINDYRWIIVHAVPQFKNGEEEPYQVYTTFDDVTDRKRADQALKASEIRYRLLAENISDVIWILDINKMRFRYVSPSVERLRGYTVDEVLQQDLSEALTLQSFQLLQEKLPTYVQEYLDGKIGFHINEVEQPCKDGSTIWTEATTSFRFNEDTSHLEVYGVSRDITERKLNEHLLMQANKQLQNHVKKIEQLRNELQEQAILDPLTGLYNRRYLAEFLAHEFKRAERENIPISLLMMDVDHFKNINDSYGHKTGDKFLIAIADLLKNNSRGSDIACRYGGEEFLLVLPGTDTQAAYDRAEQFRTQCTQIYIQYETKNINITVSAGIATYPSHTEMAEDLIHKADKALYHSKQNGRNRVMIWGEIQKESPT